MNMRQYPKYKETNIPWLGRVPEHWKVERVRSFFVESNEKNTDCEFLHAFQFNYGEIVDKNEPGNPDDYRDVYSKYTKVKKGDIMVNGLNLNYDFVSQRIARVNDDGIVTSAYIALHPFAIDSFYANYMLKALDFQKIFHGWGTGIRLTLSFEELKSKTIAVPPLPEQEAIVAFLDDKCTKIDAYVETKTKEIALLKEQKQAVINQAVTRGLNPNAPLKDSGIPWLGMVPEHWEDPIKIKYRFTEISEKGHPNEPVLCATQAYGVIPQSMYENRVVVVNKGFDNLKFVRVNDFVISLRSFQGGIEAAHYQGIISAAYTVLRANEGLNIGYVRHLFKCDSFIKLLQTCVTGIREGQNINYDHLKNNYICLPSLPEQEAIVAFLDDKCAKIDAAIANIEKQINNVKEYKQSLINDAVTGQIDVRA